MKFLAPAAFFCLGALAAPLLEVASGNAEHIVLFDPSPPSLPHIDKVLHSVKLHRYHQDVRHIYNNSAFSGFSASLAVHHRDALANLSYVTLVEESSTINTAAAVKRQASLGFTSRPNAPWGLQRISTSSSMAGNSQLLDYTYSFANSDLGNNADVYIIDTGIYTQHNAFNGRAQMLWSFNDNFTDSDGHGTHVSGTAVGDILGVASDANVWGIKALNSDGGGLSSNVVAGIDFVIQNHNARKAANNSTFRGSVLSMSLAGASPIQALDQAIRAAVSAGIHTVVAAGNNNEDACAFSPSASGGRHGPAITVGSVGITARRSAFSNFGDCVDVYAPGEDVISTWIGAPNQIHTLSGTSMATPHVAGIVAYALSNATLANDPGLMKEWVVMTALSVANGDGPLLLANNGVQADQTSSGMLGFTKIGTPAGGFAFAD